MQRASGCAGKRSPLGCVPVHSAAAISRRARCRAELISSFGCQGMFGFVNMYLVSGNPAGSPCREGPWTSLRSPRLEPVPSGSSPGRSGSRGSGSSVLRGRERARRLVDYLLDQGFAGRIGIFKVICFCNVLWDPTLDSKGNRHLADGGSPFHMAGSPRGLHKGKVLPGVHTAGGGTASPSALCTSLFEQADFQMNLARFWRRVEGTRSLS